MYIDKLAAFYRQYAQLQEAGVSVSRSLDTLAKANRGKLGSRLAALRMRVDAGETLSEAATKVPGLFNPVQLRVLAAGEKSGRVTELLNNMAVGLESESRFRSEMLTRSLYPLIILHVAALIMGLVRVLTGGSIATGLSTTVGILVPFYAVAVVVGLIWRFRMQWPIVRTVLEVPLYYIPIIRGLVRNLCLARFTRIFDALYSAGIGPVQSVPLAAEACGNVEMERRLKTCIPQLREGTHLSDALISTGCFDPMVQSMLATGAESGHMDTMLKKVSETAEFHAQQAIERAGRIIPFLIYLLIMALIISMIFSMLSGIGALYSEALAD